MKLTHRLFAFLDNGGGGSLLPGVLYKAISSLLLMEAMQGVTPLLGLPLVSSKDSWSPLGLEIKDLNKLLQSIESAKEIA